MKAANTEHYRGDELEILADTFRYQEWIADQFRPYLSGRIMEIGAGVGAMAKKWLAYADELHLVEPANNLFPVLEKNFNSSPNVSLHRGVLEEVLSEDPRLGERAFDAVIMVNVLEHIEDDARVLSVVRRILSPNGHLLIFVPAMPFLYGSLDSKFGHFRRYTKSSLASVCRKAGYEMVRIRYFDVFGALPWWFVNRVVCSKAMNPGMAKLYDRLIVPLARWFEETMPPPFGKNLVLVARLAEAKKAV